MISLILVLRLFLNFTHYGHYYFESLPIECEDSLIIEHSFTRFNPILRKYEVSKGLNVYTQHDTSQVISIVNGVVTIDSVMVDSIMNYTAKINSENGYKIILNNIDYLSVKDSSVISKGDNIGFVVDSEERPLYFRVFRGLVEVDVRELYPKQLFVHKDSNLIFFTCE